MAQSIEDRRKVVAKALRTRAQKLMKQGICRDCGLNPATPSTLRKRKNPTLCDGCRTKRRENQAAKKSAVATLPDPIPAPIPAASPRPANCANIVPAHLAR
jgi:hypothetical protein